MNRRNFIIQGCTTLAFVGSGAAASAKPEPETTNNVPKTYTRRIEADGVNIFYREAGAPDAPTRPVAPRISNEFVPVS